MNPREEIAHLTEVLERANHQYYVLDAPEMEDYEYDRLLRRLEELEAAHPELASPLSPTRRVGGEALSKFEKVEHAVPLESLQDVFSPDEVREFDGRVRESVPDAVYSVEPKVDGLSVALEYVDGAFVRGYIRTKTLRTVEPNTLYGIVVDKAAQTLTVYKNGERLGSCAVSTGLATAKYLHRETPAGEYITVTRRGTIENAGGYSKYTIRISGNYYLCEIPTTKKNGKDFSIMEDALGSKASRGNICLAHDASTDGGINAEWIWNITEENKKIKVLVFDDKDRSLVPAGSK